MIIKDKVVIVYDIETFKNCFHVVCKNTETNEYSKFEVSCRKSHINNLVSFFKNNNYIFCGYNNKHFDDPVINYIIDYQSIMVNKTYSEVCISIFNFAQTIINSEDIEIWKKWKYMNLFQSFDLLTMLYSSKLRVSLKEMQVTMHYDNVLEFAGGFDKPLEENQIDEMIVYNINDVDSTEELMKRCIKDIQLRLDIEKEYGIPCLSLDGVNLGMKILANKYMEQTGLSWNDIKDLRSPAEEIALQDVILPFVKFTDPILKKVLDDMKSQIVSPGRKGYENTFVYSGAVYNVGVGGIHTKNKPEIIIPKEDELLVDTDVASLYPSMLIEYGFYPQHLGEAFLTTYKKVKDERIEAKRNGNKTKNETLKLALNGLSGNLQNKHSFCYDPQAVMKIRINGQLLLLMLAEKLVEIGCKIVQANTDGLFVLLKKDVYQQFYNICREWEQLTKLELEEDRFKAMYQLAINDYFAITLDNQVKEKGIFITTVKLGKGLTPKIIPKAVINFFKDGVKIEDTIKNCTDIKDFLMSEKTGKQWHVEYLNEEQQRTNRFYASTNGGYLWKWKYTDKGEKQYQNMLTSSGVTLLNKFEDKPIDKYNVNYNYYIVEAYKILRELKPLQLSLWQ